MHKVVEKLTSTSEAAAPSAFPFRMTKQERESLDPNHKSKTPKRKRAALILSNAASTKDAARETLKRRNAHARLHRTTTTASKLKHRVSEEIDEIWAELDSDEDEEERHREGGERGGAKDIKEKDHHADKSDRLPEEDDDESESDGGGGGGGIAGRKRQMTKGASSTYALASLRRASDKCEGLEDFVRGSRNMFMLKYSLNVKLDEKKRLERVLREEESQLAKAEAELRLAQQAFDQFLQEKDRNAVEAQRKADAEMRSRMEKTADIKELDDAILGLKRQISKLKDELAEYATFETFLYSLSPDAWRQMQEQKSKSTQDSKATEKQLEDKSLRSVSINLEKEEEEAVGEGKEEGEDEDQKQPEKVKEAEDVEAKESAVRQPKAPTTPTIQTDDSASPEERQKSLEIAAEHLRISSEEFDSVNKEVRLYFKEPQQLLSIFTDLEDENLKLIEQCQEAEDKLENVRETTQKSRDRLNEQVHKFERDIGNLERQIADEAKVLVDLEASIAKKKRDGGGSSAKGVKEDEILESLDSVVSLVHDKCVGASRSPISTLEKLKRLELRMELLTKQLDVLPQDKVKVAQRTCERERRQREEEARQAAHREQHSERNRRALDRALKPPFVKPELRKFLPPLDVLEQRRRRLRRLRRRMQREEEADDQGGAGGADWRGADGGGGPAGEDDDDDSF